MATPSCLVRYFFFAREFSRNPGGKREIDTPWSAELFRTKYLIPLCQEFDRVVIDINGTLGFASCFLEFAFAGLSPTIASKIAIQSDEDPSLKTEIEEYLKRKYRNEK